MPEYIICDQCGVAQLEVEFRTMANGHKRWRDRYCKTCRGEEVLKRVRKRQTKSKVTPFVVDCYMEGDQVVQVLPPAAGFI